MTRVILGQVLVSTSKNTLILQGFWKILWHPFSYEIQENRSTFYQVLPSVSDDYSENVDEGLFEVSQFPSSNF